MSNLSFREQAAIDLYRAYSNESTDMAANHAQKLAESCCRVFGHDPVLNGAQVTACGRCGIKMGRSASGDST